MASRPMLRAMVVREMGVFRAQAIPDAFQVIMVYDCSMDAVFVRLCPPWRRRPRLVNPSDADVTGTLPGGAITGARQPGGWCMGLYNTFVIDTTERLPLFWGLRPGQPFRRKATTHKPPHTSHKTSVRSGWPGKLLRNFRIRRRMLAAGEQIGQLRHAARHGPSAMVALRPHGRRPRAPLSSTVAGLSRREAALSTAGSAALAFVLQLAGFASPALAAKPRLDSSDGSSPGLAAPEDEAAPK